MRAFLLSAAGIPPPPHDEADWPDGAHAVASPVQGSVWKVLVEEGAVVDEGDTLLVVESMKMEFAVVAPRGGRVWRIACREGGAVGAGQNVAVLLSNASSDGTEGL